jgi:oligopeptide transport system substrate-binding protein
VNQILGDPREGPSTYFQVVNAAFMQTAVATAHRHRIDILVQYLVGLAQQARAAGRPFRVLNVGCGPAEEIARFLGDPSPDAYERMVDRHLGSSHYGERRGKFWLDAAGYADLLAGNLDFMEQVPASALVGNQFEKDLPGRSVNKPVGIIQTATLPTYAPGYDDPNLGKALSLAIDRPTITKAVFNGGRTPATGWVSPIVAGYKAGACGEFCTYDAAKAKEYLAKSKFKGPFSFSYNSDGPGNKEAAEAICNSIKNALGVDCQPNPYVDFSTLRKDVNGQKMKSLFRTGWQMDYPHIENFLEPLYVTGAGSNDGKYSNKEFDTLIKKANSEDGDAANATYQQAEAILSQNMSIIPLWYQAQQSGWSERMQNVKVTPRSTLDLIGLSVK